MVNWGYYMGYALEMYLLSPPDPPSRGSAWGSMVQGDLKNAFSGSAKCLEFGYCPNPVTVYIRSPIKGYI